MRDVITRAIVSVCIDLFNKDVDVVLSRPSEQFGDYSTNVALQLAAKLNKNPREIADQLVHGLSENLKDKVSEITVAGPGFINLKLSDKALSNELSKVDQHYGQNDLYKNQVVVAEYSDPNPFKVLHAGHLYTSIVGDAISNLLEAAGAKTHRVNFGGDVGLHVAKALWGILQKLGGENPDKLASIPKEQHADWMADAYVAGNEAYENNDSAKAEIIELNKRVYQVQAAKDKTSAFGQIYWTCRQWSYDYFDSFYDHIGSHFEKYYPESETAELGTQAVKDNVGKVFEQSDGAIVYRGEEHGLHTRVFINSGGLPTYEAKDIGLALHKWQDYHFDKSVIITGNDIEQYMKVVLKALEHIEPEIPGRTIHLTHGLVKLKGSGKMSSRKGNVLRAADVLDSVSEAAKRLNQKADWDIALGAVKYAFTKHRLGGDIILDVNESVSVEGNSGPYLQYAHARAQSILRKSSVPEAPTSSGNLEPDERSLLRKISEYPEVVENAVKELMPHHICTYLYELAQVFNRFYESNRVIGDPREGLRLQLIKAYAQVLKNGLSLLNITAPEQM